MNIKNTVIKLLVSALLMLVVGGVSILGMRNHSFEQGFGSRHHRPWEISALFILVGCIVCMWLPEGIMEWSAKKKWLFGIAFFMLFMVLFFGSIILIALLRNFLYGAGK